MKTIWLLVMRLYLSLGLFFYFRKIQVFGAHNISKNKPILLLSNHQNALLDALLIAIKCKRFAYFLTRAGVFNKPLIARVLKSLQMLPVYRIRDGWSNLSNNNAIFKTCSKLLNNNEAVVIFPEGNHNLNRTVRPLSKGFTRIILDTLESYPDIDLQLQPVGLNFKNATNFPDEVSIFFGVPIKAKKYQSLDNKGAAIELKTKVQSEISKLTTHIPQDNYESILKRLDMLNADFLDPLSVNNCIASNFTNCVETKNISYNTLGKVFKFFLVCNTLPPYIIWKCSAEPKVKEKEFLSTFRFAMAITIFPIYLILVSITIGFILSVKLAFLYFIFVLLLVLGTTKL